MLIYPFLMVIALLWQPVFAADELTTEVLQQDRGRDYGLMVGELIHHHYIIAVDSDYTLTPSSLPAEGELSYWLDLNAVNFSSTEKGNKTLYRLNLSYQTFYAPLDVRALTIPAIELDFANTEKNRVSLTLDDWTFTMSPIKEITPSGVGNDTGIESFMKASIKPRLIRLQQIEDRLVFITILVIICVLSYIAVSGWIPHLNRSPFIQARQRIKQLRHHDLNQQEYYQVCLQAMHQAINQRAGQTIFMGRLDYFLDTHPAFSTLEKPLREFFTHSQESFFFDQPPKPSYIPDCIKLCSQLADVDKVSTTS